ncbi:MAG TPA: hypothetical protein VJ816_09200 [Gemmatimonadales bacterium]|nr:hypothetical protein [Gemmatimonadales bacterium]
MRPRYLAVACALAAGLCGLSTPAATVEQTSSRELALRRFQFEQLLAFQRARGASVVAGSPYAPMPSMQLPDAKAQFEKIGGKLVPTIPTNDELLQRAIAKTYRQMLAGNSCCPCANSGTCTDGLFCTGVEVCVNSLCTYGPPACNDGNPCTIDSCTENTDTCSFTPVPPPAEVAQLNVGRSAPLSTVATLAWSGVSGAASYNVYRSSAANLGSLACFQGGVTGTSLNDNGAVPAGAFYFLISSKACGESGLGTGMPNPRPPAPGCP